MWKGTAEILNSSPTEVVMTASTTTGSHGDRAAMAAATSASLVEPAMPYISEKPYTRNPLENAPSSRYFMAASLERLSVRRKPTMT